MLCAHNRDMRLNAFLVALILGIGVFLTLDLKAQAEDTRAITAGHDCARLSPGVQLLTTMPNSRDADFHCLEAIVDVHANITAIRLETNIFDDDADAPGGISHKIRIREFSLSDIASAKGAVLDGVPGHDALIMQGDILGGRLIEPIVIKFLYNGLTNEFHECPATLSRDEEGDWHLVNAANHAVPLIIIKLRIVPIIGAIGIETMEGLCI